MAKQQVILVDNNDRKLGAEEKLKAHQKNLKHRAFSVFIFNNRNQLFLQKRNKNQYHSGGLWSNTCCSHPAPGEETAQAAKRRLKEEMGISCSLKEIFSFNYQTKLGGIFENEFDHVFVGRYNGNPKPDPKEVEAWQWVDLKKLITDIKGNPRKYSFWFKKVIDEYLSKIYNHLQRPNPYCQASLSYDFVLKKKINRITFYLPSRGCAKARESGPCTMCVFYQPWKLLKTSNKKPNKKTIFNLYQKYVLPAIEFTQACALYFYIGGSILDENELPFAAFEKVIRNLAPNIQKIGIESRPEFVTDEALVKLKKILPQGAKLTIYLGAETADDKYRNQILNKNIANEDIIAILKRLKKHKVKVGAYLLAGLPHLSRKASVLEARKSIKWCAKVGFDEIDLCPTLVPQGRSILGALYQKKQFYPLNLQEIIKIIKGFEGYPLFVASEKNDPPARAGREGSKKEEEYIFNFNQRNEKN